jgi:diguanylate cyclase (GGDEF)-like protein
MNRLIHMTPRRIAFLIAFILTPTLTVHALVPVVLTASEGENRLSRYLEILADSSGRISREEAAQTAGWKPFTGNVPNYGLTASVYWARFVLENRSPSTPFFLELGFPSMDSVTLFLPTSADYTVKEAGDSLPFAARELPERTFIFTLPPEAAGTVYMRFQTEGTMTFPLTIWSRDAYLAHAYITQLLFGAFWGLVTGLFFYNLFLLISLKDTSYLFYVLYVLFFFFFQLNEDGFASQFLWPGSPWLANRASPIFLGGTLFSILGFTRIFTSTRANAPLLDKAFPVAMGASVALAAASVLLDYRMLITIGTSLVFVAAVLVAVAGILALKKGYGPARYFLAAWSVLIATAVIGNSEVGGWISFDFYSVHAVKLGVAIELVLLSLALADRINAMKLERRLLAELATVDTKTKVSNYRHFDTVLQQEIRRSIRYRRPLSLIMLDIDDFKRINDEYGHKAGDDVLLATAAVLMDNCRDVDVVARFGGDEFVVMLPETDLDSGKETASKLRNLLEGIRVSYEGTELAITVSLGVANLPIHAHERNALVGAADKALYLAKEGGKNRVCVMDAPAPA